MRALILLIPIVLLGQTDSPPPIPIAQWDAPRYWMEPAQDSKVADKSGTRIVAQVNPTASSPLAFVAITPCRLVDTRSSAFQAGFGLPALVAQQPRTIPAQQQLNCDLPASARAYSVNFTVVPRGALGYLSAWPTGNRPSPEFQF
jgi:hypothetical protein